MECNVSVIICQLPGSINIKMCTAMIYEYKFIIIHNYIPTSTPPQKHTMPENRFLTNVLIYLTLGQAVRQAIEWKPLLKARVINSSAMLCAADFVEVPTPRTRTLSLKFYTKESPPPRHAYIFRILFVVPSNYSGRTKSFCSNTFPATLSSSNTRSASGN